MVKKMRIEIVLCYVMLLKSQMVLGWSSSVTKHDDQQLKEPAGIRLIVQCYKTRWCSVIF